MLTLSCKHSFLSVIRKSKLYYRLAGVEKELKTEIEYANELV